MVVNLKRMGTARGTVFCCYFSHSSYLFLMGRAEERGWLAFLVRQRGKENEMVCLLQLQRR